MAADSMSNAPSRSGAIAFNIKNGTMAGPTGSMAYVYRVRIDVNASTTTSLVPCTTLEQQPATNVDVVIRSAPSGASCRPVEHRLR